MDPSLHRSEAMAIQERLTYVNSCKSNEVRAVLKVQLQADFHCLTRWQPRPRWKEERKAFNVLAVPIYADRRVRIA